MNLNENNLENVAAARKIHVHDSFAELLLAQPTMHTFDLSLLDCYRLAGHACHATTSAFLMVEAAIKELYPTTNTCERGDLIVEFGSQLEEKASGPRSQVISYITGAWGSTGFAGFKSQFVRKNLLSFDHNDIPKSAIRFKRSATDQSIIVDYNVSRFLTDLNCGFQFPLNWRVEICAILQNTEKVLSIVKS